MRITFKLFAMLTDYLPAEARRSNQIELDVDSASTISQIIEPFGQRHLHQAGEPHGDHPERGRCARDMAAHRWRLGQRHKVRMQSHYLESFVRDMACTEKEWLSWLPNAIGEWPWVQTGPSVRISFGPGELAIGWQPLPPRVIALMRMPRLEVSFRFQGLDDAQRYTFMKRFDLYMQRGGG